MKSNHQEFLDKYFAEENRKKQLSMMKDYMLSLSPEKLIEFMNEPMRFFEKALKNPEVSDDTKKKIFDHLDEMTFLLKGKVTA